MVIANNTQTQTYTNTWSGTQSYYTVGGNAYVLASDGITVRTTTNDNDINFIKLGPDTVSFQIFNSVNNAPVSFSLGADCSGV